MVGPRRSHTVRVGRPKWYVPATGHNPPAFTATDQQSQCPLRSPGSTADSGQAFLAAFSVLELAILLLWLTNPRSGTRLSVPAASVEFAAACTLCVLSSYEHARTVAPSALIGCYIIISVVVDVVRLRTLFLLRRPGSESIAAVLALATAIKLGVVVTEAATKRHILLERYRSLPPEVLSNIYSKAVFWWINPLFKAGFRHILHVGDLYDIDDALRSDRLKSKLQNAWQEAHQSSKHAFLRAVLWMLKWHLLSAAVPRLLLIGVKYSQPFLLQRTISYVSNRHDQPANIGWGLVGAYALVFTALAILTASNAHLQNRCVTMIRGGLVATIYAKTVDLSLTELNESAALTLMSADVDRITEIWVSFHEGWATMIEIAIALFLLYRRLGWAMIAPASIFLVAMVGMSGIVRVFGPAQKRWIEGEYHALELAHR